MPTTQPDPPAAPPSGPRVLRSWVKPSVSILVAVVAGALGGFASPWVSDWMCQHGYGCEHKVDITVQPPIPDVNFDTFWNTYGPSTSAGCSEVKPNPFLHPETTPYYGAIFPVHIDTQGYKKETIVVTPSVYNQEGVRLLQGLQPMTVSITPTTQGEPTSCFIWVQYPDWLGLPGFHIFVRFEAFLNPPKGLLDRWLHGQPGLLPRLQFTQAELQPETYRLFVNGVKITPQHMYRQYDVPEDWYKLSTSSAAVSFASRAWVPLGPFATKIMKHWTVLSTDRGTSLCGTQWSATIDVDGTPVTTALQTTNFAGQCLGFISPANLFGSLEKICQGQSGHLAWYITYSADTKIIAINTTRSPTPCVGPDGGTRRN